MVAIGIAAELIYATSGRFSIIGDSILQLIPFGILLYGLLEHFFPRFCCRYRRFAPAFLLAYSVGMLVLDMVPFSLFIATLFGVITGLFICASLVSFLESGEVKNLGLKIGISASLYSVAVYPFSIGYRYFLKLLPKMPITTIGFLILMVLLAVVFYLWPEADEKAEPFERTEVDVITPRYLTVLLIGLVVLIALGQVMNSGTLEKQGGITGIPWLYLFIIILRIPFGALLGHWIDKRPSALIMTVPIVLMALGCFAPLFRYGTSVGSVTAYLLLNIGEKGVVFLVCILCATMAIRHRNKGFIAGFGLLVYFASEGYLNLHRLGISLTSFNNRIDFPLMLTIILFAFLVCLFLVYLASRMQNERPGQEDRSEAGESLQDISAKYHLTPRETETLQLVIEGKDAAGIAQAMGIEKNSAQNNVGALMNKTGTRPRSALAAQFRHIKF